MAKSILEGPLNPPPGLPSWGGRSDLRLRYLGWGVRDFQHDPVVLHCDRATNYYISGAWRDHRNSPRRLCELYADRPHCLLILPAHLALHNPAEKRSTFWCGFGKEGQFRRIAAGFRRIPPPGLTASLTGFTCGTAFALPQRSRTCRQLSCGESCGTAQAG